MSIFQTQRIKVRYLTHSDIEGFFNMQSNPNVMRYVKPTMNYEESKKELERFIDYYSSDDIFFKIWAMENIRSKEFLGICGVYKNDYKEFEIAYRLREQFWGNGYGGEIAKGLIQYCFEELKLLELTAYVYKNNIGSCKILEREMKFEKEFFSKKTNSWERMYKLKEADWNN